MKRILLFVLSTLLLTLLFSGCSKNTEPPVLTKCLNIGNCLEAPKNQPWDVPMNISYFSKIKQAGFQCVRLPVRFSDYVDKSNSDYLLAEDFMTQIDSYINEALNQNLTLILDLHHFTEIMEAPNQNKECLIAIWKQLAKRYKEYPETLVFELLNEPQQNLDSDTWNEILSDTVKVIRSIDKTHYLIVGGANYNSIDALSSLKLPKDDRLIATIHYYEPNNVTFQGNPYHEGYENIANVEWEGTSDEVSYLQSRLKTAKSWADTNQVSLFLGEFGISNKAPAQTRINWTLAVAKEAEALDISYGYWEFASGFGIYDLTTSTWNQDMVDAIIHHSNQ
ncbi:endoglucanase [Lachnotalea glycerini]|uniref:Endoglucanase n=1 Tax=Lachnotalea glycerini TaxID=1763509 RepID=A0A318EQ88_9FIRM|nr:glycoside hydrolase family 5 protein [Lachnotalea glycerini]PXV88312.1 endoglucanase [Lachnotalea glycerini]